MTRGGAGRAGRWVLAGVAVAALSACDDEPVADDYVLAEGESLAELRQQAGRHLARYDRAVAEAGAGGTVAVSPPAWDTDVGVPGMAIESATVTAAGTRLTVAFTGAPVPAAEPCGIDYAAEVVESATAVVVVLLAQHHAYHEVCPMVGFSRTAAVNLARPLDGRAVLDVRQGQPVPVSTAG